MCMCICLKAKLAGPTAQSVWEPQLSFVFLSPTIAMAIRILPGAFDLEPCRVNRNQATLKFDEDHVFYNGSISMLVDGDQSCCIAVGTDKRLRCSRLARERFWHVINVCDFDVLGTVQLENH